MTTTQTDQYLTLLASFERSLLAEKKSPKTIDAYLSAARVFHAYLVEQGMPLEVAHIKREHVEMWMIAQLAKHKPGTANNSYRSLQQYFRWLSEDGEIKESPMAHMKPPSIPESPPPVWTEDQIKALLKVCEGKDFEQRRDHAIIRLLLDTGMRRNGEDTLTFICGAAEILRLKKATTGGGWQIMDEADSDPTTTELDSLDSGSFYFKNNKFVIAYNNAGTITYISIPLDGSSTAWTHSTVAP